MSTNLIRNTDPPEEPKNRLVFGTAKKEHLIERAHAAIKANRTRTEIAMAGLTDAQRATIDQIAYHLQQAMQLMRDDAPGSLEFEMYCGRVYNNLYLALNDLVAGPPAPPSCLQSDLDDVMGGEADGTTRVPEVQEVKTSTPE